MWKYALAAFLLLTGLMLVTNVRFAAQDILTGIAAILAAVLLVLDR